ncbi:hypothetical protein [Moorella sulfitireducens (nom. illeg.)]|uniref:hypothetical protein n=1 Tax=Neomoorella sulfitireducens TaxID=2972948 RepID=UPI0021AC94FE|nr:hypothetical protein [Moorella sulfitireducens]
MSVAKEELYRLIEALPEKETPVVKRFLEFLLTYILRGKITKLGIYSISKLGRY